MARSRKDPATQVLTPKHLESLNSECRSVLIARSLLRIPCPLANLDQDQHKSLTKNLKESSDLLYRIAKTGQQEDVGPLKVLANEPENAEHTNFAELITKAADALVSVGNTNDQIEAFFGAARDYLLTLDGEQESQFLTGVEQDRRSLIAYEHNSDWWEKLGNNSFVQWPIEWPKKPPQGLTHNEQNDTKDEHHSNTTVETLPPVGSLELVKSLVKQIDVALEQAKPNEVAAILKLLHVKTFQVLEPTVKPQTDSGANETIVDEQATIVEADKDDEFAFQIMRLKQTTDAVAETAQKQLEVILRESEGVAFEPAQLESARRLVSTINHLAAIGKCELLFEAQVITLGCTSSAHNPRPMFNLRKSGEGKERVNIYARKNFPKINSKKL